MPDEPILDEPIPDEPTYYARSWSDVPQYCCGLCGCDAWSLAQLEMHMAVAHNGAPLVAAPPGKVIPLAPVLTEAPANATLQAEGV
jgi:hypothetical protein